MAFISDSVNSRIYDPERGYELTVVGGGSDGAVRFKITGPEREFTFSASINGEKLSPAEIAELGSNYNQNYVVWCVQYWLDEWKQIIRQALQAYIIGHGSPIPNSTAYVRFGLKGSLINA